MPLNWRFILRCGLTFWLWYYLPVIGEVFSSPAIGITLTPTMGFEPLTVHGYVTIEPNAFNRSACLEWDAEEVGGMSCWDLDGKKASPSKFYEVKGLTEGSYQFQATLYREGDDVESNAIQVRVLGHGEPE